MQVFIVGATGVYGRNLIPMLLKRGHQMQALVRRPDQQTVLQAQGVQAFVGDLLEADTQRALPSLLSGSDAVLHLATAIPPDATSPDAWEANTALRTTGTQALLAATLLAGPVRYLQQSIVMAYEDGGDRWLDETTPLTGRGRNGVAVATMEGLVRAIPPQRLSWCILRGGSFVGPGTAQEQLLESLRLGREVVPGDGSHYISPIHVADMASATVAALDSAPAGSIFNVADQPLRYGDYVDRLAQLIGLRAPRRDPALRTPASHRADSTAIRKALGWVPRRGPWPELPN